MSVIIVNSLDEKVWREFVDQHPQSNIFHTPEMFQVYARVRGYQPQIWAAVSDCGNVLALLIPVQVTLLAGILHRLTTRYIAYGSILCSPDPQGKEALALLLNTYTREKGREALFSELRNIFDLSEIQPVITQCGFLYEDHLNFLIDLNCSPEQLFRRIGSRTRKHISRELKKRQVIVEQVAYPTQIRTCHELIKKSYLAAHVPMADLSLFESAFDVLSPRGMVKFWLARIDDAYVAASVELIYKDRVFGWYGGVDRSYSSHAPSELLTWHILKWCAENGYRTYDFGGAGTPEEKYGVRDFKSKFGGKLVCYGRNTYIQSPGLLRLSTVGYSIYRRFFNG
jgi:serine/alanine adding enzyme